MFRRERREPRGARIGIEGGAFALPASELVVESERTLGRREKTVREKRGRHPARGRTRPSGRERGTAAWSSKARHGDTSSRVVQGAPDDPFTSVGGQGRVGVRTCSDKDIRGTTRGIKERQESRSISAIVR